MSLINLNGFYGYLQDGDGNYIVVSHGAFLGPFRKEHIPMMKEIIEALIRKREGEA